MPTAQEYAPPDLAEFQKRNLELFGKSANRNVQPTYWPKDSIANDVCLLEQHNRQLEDLVGEILATLLIPANQANLRVDATGENHAALFRIADRWNERFQALTKNAIQDQPAEQQLPG